jgi:ribosome-binding ATPase YchF (GTP1/OBG family)
MDALALVLRNFTDEIGESPDPVGELNSLMDEFAVADLITVENRIERIDWSIRRGQKVTGAAEERELMVRLQQHLETSQPLSDLSLKEHEYKLIRGYGFLTLKPLMIILNSSEELFGTNGELMGRLSQAAPALDCAGLFEQEISAMESDEDRLLFMEDIGITESARDRITQLAYSTLGYISFFTVGSDEVRAWNLRRGLSARDAAGVIHTDLARGFIRAECFHYEDLVDLGSESVIKEQGKWRLEGKDYTVRDGDILSIRSGV